MRTFSIRMLDQPQTPICTDLKRYLPLTLYQQQDDRRINQSSVHLRFVDFQRFCRLILDFFFDKLSESDSIFIIED